ncbi:hypothetical protein HHI36_012677 [Cryptolaemus montrouzieri]|uniref:Lipase n=1 Tax=Cryptolaemus montrouzieri TaxID=559131 RepID=A0ABD2NEY6_9CUCU
MTSKSAPILFLLFIIIVKISTIRSWKIDYNKDADANLDELIQKWGYDGIESHFVTTTDGYILNVLRIKRKGAGKLMPIIFVHGLTGCSESYFIGKNESAPIVFANNGYDIWLLNSRGTDRSLGHEKWNATTDKEYWLFSWQEIGLFDLPSTIDLVLQKNEHKKVILLGHSEGSTVIFVMLSEVPEYNEKVSLAVHWGSAVYHNDQCRSIPLFKIFCSIVHILPDLLDSLGWYTIYPNRKIAQFLSDLCKFEEFRNVCNQIGQFVVFQKESPFLETVDWSYVFTKAFCGGSTREFIHYLQNAKSGQFAKYDFGASKNLQIYNSTESPVFRLRNIKSAQVIWCGSEDIHCKPSDIKRLTDQLTTVEWINIKVKSSLSHVDFLLVDDIQGRIYDDLLDILKKFTI